MKKHATTILLVFAAVVLGVWLWVDRDRVTEGERRRRENNVFPAWRRDELSRIEIQRDAEVLVLERDAKAESSWRMKSPRDERADQAAVERLVMALEFATVLRKVGEGGDLGLDPPRARGSVTMGGLVHRFALGGASPRPEGSGYLRLDDAAPFVVSRELVDALLSPVDTYRDRTVVPYLSLEVARFQVSRPGGGFTLEHMEKQAFRVAEVGVMASREALDKVWGALGEMRAEAFPDEAEAERLARDPVLSITMTPKDAAKPAAELVVGGTCPGHPDDVVVMRKAPSRVAACAPKGAVDALLATPSQLVQAQPFTLRADEIEELRLERVAGDAGAGDAGADAPPEAIEIARKGTGWHARAPFDRDLSPEEADAASELVARIAKSEADLVTRAGTEPFTAVARARVRGGEHEEVIELGAPTPEGRVPVRRKLDGARLEVSAAVARRLLPRATSLAPRSLLGESRRPTRVLLRCGAPQELVDRGEGFRLIDPPGFETDGAIVQLVEGLARGRVEVWVADADDGTFGLRDDGCRVVLGFEDGNAPATIHFGAEGEGGAYGRVEGSPRVFVAPKPLREMASDLFVSRAALRVDPARVERVRVRVDGRDVPGDLEARKSALGALFAAKVERFGARLPAGEKRLEVEVAVSEGGAPRRITCAGSAGEGRRSCTTSGVDATFAVAEARLAPLFGERDAGAGAAAADGGEGGLDVAHGGGSR